MTTATISATAASHPVLHPLLLRRLQHAADIAEMILNRRAI